MTSFPHGLYESLITRVLAALDFQRLRERLGKENGRARLLFVAHREEILTQSQATFAHALRDANFGELWVGGWRPEAYERKQALRDLERGDVAVVFSVDLFNEGVDVPTVDALLMLRPTESPLLFLQQLGRGFRKAEGKAVCTVLDFVGHHRREFRYDRRFRALLGGTRKEVEREVAEGFPFLPAGCHTKLDRVASERVLASVRNALPRNITERAEELRELATRQGGVTLKQFLDATGLDLDDVYAGNYSWSDLRDRAGLETAASGNREKTLRVACGRLLHVDDPERLATWRRWLQHDVPPAVGVSVRDDRLLRMLLGQLLLKAVGKRTSLQKGAELLWNHPQVRRELDELFEVLQDRVSHVTPKLEILGRCRCTSTPATPASRSSPRATWARR